MLTATTDFLGALEQWVRAVRENDFNTARGHAQSLIDSGEKMAIHPDFAKCFGGRFPAVEPRDALGHICQFLVCATDGRARVLKDWVEGTRPIDRLNEPYQ